MGSVVQVHPDPPERDDRGCSSAGRAPRLQRGGRRFDPDQLHHASGIGCQQAGLVADSAATEVAVCRLLIPEVVRLFFKKVEEVKAI